eukprot:1727298-Amphidinium_carterae.1
MMTCSDKSLMDIVVSLWRILSSLMQGLNRSSPIDVDVRKRLQSSTNNHSIATIVIFTSWALLDVVM